MEKLSALAVRVCLVDGSPLPEEGGLPQDEDELPWQPAVAQGPGRRPVTRWRVDFPVPMQRERPTQPSATAQLLALLSASTPHKGRCKVACMEEEEYEVEKVMAQRTGPGGQVEYMVKWVGWPKDDCTWEPASALSECQVALREWDSRHEVASSDADAPAPSPATAPPAAPALTPLSGNVVPAPPLDLDLEEVLSLMQVSTLGASQASQASGSASQLRQLASAMSKAANKLDGAYVFDRETEEEDGEDKDGDGVDDGEEDEDGAAREAAEVGRQSGTSQKRPPPRGLELFTPSPKRPARYAYLEWGGRQLGVLLGCLGKSPLISNEGVVVPLIHLAINDKCLYYDEAMTHWKGCFSSWPQWVGQIRLAQECRAPVPTAGGCQELSVRGGEPTCLLHPQ